MVVLMCLFLIAAMHFVYLLQCISLKYCNAFRVRMKIFARLVMSVRNSMSIYSETIVETTLTHKCVACKIEVSLVFHISQTPSMFAYYKFRNYHFVVFKGTPNCNHLLSCLCYARKYPH